MLRQKTFRPSLTTVKMFPRLAPAMLEPRLQVAVIKCQERDKVRARLLRMILDNERTRRNNWPTTSVR